MAYARFHTHAAALASSRGYAASAGAAEGVVVMELPALGNSYFVVASLSEPEDDDDTASGDDWTFNRFLSHDELDAANLAMRRWEAQIVTGRRLDLGER